MDITLFLALATTCAPQVDVGTARALVAVESAFNPYAIGVVGGALVRQPRHRAEAVATARALQAGGWNFSLGLAQINVRNFERLGLSTEDAFDPCANLAAMQAVLVECFTRVVPHEGAAQSVPQPVLRQALSCYYSGNFVTGFEHGYVRRVATAAARPSPSFAMPKESP
ncbi:lytic transglycosylase domain-containing protein [Methylibium sp.]|uniref:lytic transglycosylase domain-containing protein n=1 Tax=Methylibium sp. TaxID=2067992 RepID=UPI003D0B7907